MSSMANWHPLLLGSQRNPGSTVGGRAQQNGSTVGGGEHGRRGAHQRGARQEERSMVGRGEHSRTRGAHQEDGSTVEGKKQWEEGNIAGGGEHS